MTVMVDLDCTVLLPGRSLSGYSGNSRSECERKVALFSTAIVSITFVITGGGTNNLKCGAQNCKDKISKYLSWPKLGNNTKVAKYCSIIV